MKEVKFRWIDKYLIHMTLRTKFAVLALVPILILILFAYLLLASHQASTQHILANLTQTQSQHINKTIEIALKQLPESAHQNFIQQLPAQLQVMPKNSASHDARTLAQEGGGVTNDLTQAFSSSNQFNLITGLEVPKAAMNADSSTLGLIVGAALAILVTCYYISTFVGGALFTSVRALKQAADGDLTGRLNFFEVKDEFSILAISIDTLVERQHNLVKLISQATVQIRQVVTDFKQNAEQGQDLAINQREHLDSLATAMEEMTAAVKEVARNAEQSSTETQETNNQVAAGSKDISETVDSIELLSTEIGNASEAVATLNENACKIDEVVTTINAISEQTNLLALNAAIEAARAGEQGRGFAVVADEVRTLAGRTQAATVEIKAMIEALQSGSQQLTQVMGKTVEQADEGKKHVLRTGDDLVAIASHSNTVLEMSVQIATSAEEQSSVANEIATNLMEIRNQSHDVEQSANRAVSGCDELQATAEQMDQLLVGLKV
ncbi:methyl-accepting chemotaxis protein [Shewanella gelidii]|uniref:Chemotaxis protein n=1 Tax=Shewanella gelidii TaxID=1642821 RepID=A0A917JVP9_9GAMM|nr:methyl-accepting chemotaxis protein [Shewanella gelidii]MCL1098982.1 methyl-accepting chemotaxis protein [Shewanella gelidii]GGI89119.1 chemotaxis protein [Shewanella gelidii]